MPYSSAILTIATLLPMLAGIAEFLENVDRGRAVMGQRTVAEEELADIF